MPKQYLDLMGQPIAMHSLRTFGHMPEVGEIVIVCDPSYRWALQLVMLFGMQTSSLTQMLSRP